LKSAILIVTHGNFGTAMLRACERMLGAQERCASIELTEGMGREDLAALIAAKRAGLGPCLVLVDMLGGTPWNAALAGGLDPDAEVLAGLSLPLLLEAVSLREKLAPRALASALARAAGASFAQASVLLEGKRT
jgi:PTS system mannose-specific IIA component